MKIKMMSVPFGGSVTFKHSISFSGSLYSDDSSYPKSGKEVGLGFLHINLLSAK